MIASCCSKSMSNVKNGTAAPFEPDWVVAPGATLALLIAESPVSRESFATSVGRNVEFLNRLLLGIEAVDEELAERLACCLGTSASFWLQRERAYREGKQRLLDKQSVDALEKWTKQFPLRDMHRLGWIEDFATKRDAIQRCLQFFDVPDLPAWQSRYEPAAKAVAFRMTRRRNSEPGAVTAWLRWAELISSRMDCGDWDRESFQERLHQIRALTWHKNPRAFLPKLRRLCASVGVCVVVAPTPRGCPASGATRFLSPKKAMMVLSFRYRSDDQFWFTFFHEAAHLILHSQSALFIEEEDVESSNEEEEANEFAETVLMPVELRKEFECLSLDKDSIISFAKKSGIAPGLIIGQLQHQKKLAPHEMNWLKRRYSWCDIDSGSLIP